MNWMEEASEGSPTSFCPVRVQPEGSSLQSGRGLSAETDQCLFTMSPSFVIANYAVFV